MKGFVQGTDRQQTTLLPECLDDWVEQSNPVRAVEVFVEALELRDLGFDGVDPAATGRPAYHPSPMLKLYIYGYLNRVQSSRRLEREAGRNLEVMWLTGRLIPDHKTIADFRKDNGPAIKRVCAQFVALCREMGLLAKASVAIDGSKFKAVNSRDHNFTKGKMERRLAQIEESVARYLSQLDTADRQTAAGEAPSEELAARTTRLKEKLAKLEEEVKRQLDVLDRQLAGNRFIAGDEYTIADIAIWPWYGNGMLNGASYNDPRKFLQTHEYKNLTRWTKEIGERPAVKRGQMVNRTSGPLEGQLHERHDASDFETRTQDKIGVLGT